MKNLLALIQNFDSAVHSPVEIFNQSKIIQDEIATSQAFDGLNLSDAQVLKNMLNGIVNTKLQAIENEIAAKPVYTEQKTIQEIFAQKIIDTLQNTQGSVTPFYNMGVTDAQMQSENYAFPRNLDNYKLISTQNGVVPVLHTVPQINEVVGHDWVTFSFDQSELGEQYANIPKHLVNESLSNALSLNFDHILFDIFGFGLGSKREKGMHFYKHGFDLQDGLGLVLFAHKSNRISVQINGTACALARNGWQNKLYHFLKSCKNPKLNRVDLAYDDFTSEHISLDLVDQWDDEDLFWSTGSHPEINHLGDWKRINGKGRTITIGNRSTGKFARFYERGKKEGDSLSLWVRAEVEFKSTDRYIPLEILLAPTQFFKGSYPALEILCNDLEAFDTPTKTQIVKKQSEINVQKALDVTKHQFGKYIRQFRKFIEDSALLDLITSEKDEMPKRLKFSHAAVMQAVRINEPTYTTQIDSGIPPLFQSLNINQMGQSYAI